MSNNIIQIKRSATSAAPSTLNAGELAYSNATGGSGVLYIGSTDGASVVPIGGVRNPGILTANQALVANSTSGINNIITANLAISGYLTANGSLGTSGQVLTSNATGGVYFAAPSGGSFNQGTAYTFTALETFSAGINVSSNAVFNSNVLLGSIGASSNGVLITNTSINIGNSSVNTTINSTAFSGSANNASYLGGVAAGSYVNTSGNYTVAGNINFTATNNFFSSIVYVGANVYANTTSLFVGNATVNTTVNSSQIAIGTTFVANTTSLNAASLGITGSATIGGNLTVTGNLTLAGATTFVNTTVITTNDLNIILANNAGTATLANNSGLVVGTYANLIYNNATSSWQSNVNFTPATTTTYNLGSSSLYWANAYANQIYGTLMTTSQPNITANNASYLGGVAAASYVNTSGNFTVAGNINFTSTNTFFSSDFYVGANVYVNTSTISVGNSTVNTVINSTSISANSLTLVTALGAGSGGTGINSYTTGSLLYATGTTSLSQIAVPGSSANGQVLQIINNLPTYGTLDGGAF